MLLAMAPQGAMGLLSLWAYGSHSLLGDWEEEKGYTGRTHTPYSTSRESILNLYDHPLERVDIKPL